MSNESSSKPVVHSANDQIVFWGCFIALISTAFAFTTRMYLCDNRFPDFFDLNDVQIGVLKGAGIWPFGISIILFSLVIDRIGYRVAMFFSFACYALYLVLACMAYSTVQGVAEADLPAAQLKGYNLMYWGSIILGLGNGTVEAFINPVVATMFNREKTKWLNILHAGWPGGLVIAGIITISMATIATEKDWRLVLGLIAIPAVVYLVMLAKASFPKSEREQAGVSYREMLGEFGAFGALVGFGLIFSELGNTFSWPLSVSLGLAAVVTVAFGVYTQSFGRGILAFLIIIMMPLAITEIGTDGWITGLMAGPMESAGLDAGWVLVYTSAIMMTLRFFAGPIVHKLSPIGLLTLSCVLAIAGLTALSKTNGAGLAAILAAATLYGFGKTFFWPTMLGVTAEQCPKGGALTLNAISGIGMIAVGVLGFPFIGFLKADTAATYLKEKNEVVAKQVLSSEPYLGVITYEAIDPAKVTALEAKAAEAEEPDTQGTADILAANRAGEFDALAKMAGFPTFMLLCYIALFMYFKSKGGYKAEVLTGHGAEDEKFTGGLEGPADA
ncbi:MAG: MFS transporter [Planctomycetaceae bacterium]